MAVHKKLLAQEEKDTRFEMCPSDPSREDGAIWLKIAVAQVIFVRLTTALAATKWKSGGDIFRTKNVGGWS